MAMPRFTLTSISAALLVLGLSAVHAQDDLRKQANSLFKPIPDRVAELQGHAITPDQVSLGKQLFFDPRLSASQTISCNSCHNLGRGGADNTPTSIGHAWQKGGRNSPTVLNAVFNIAQFWDGRAADLKEQAKGPVQNPIEMHNTPAVVEKTLASMPEYVTAFGKAFPGDKNPVSFDNMAHAIQAFEATLITPDSRFDLFLKGDDKAITDAEKAGLKTFITSGCAICHGGVNVGGGAYYPFGVTAKPGEKIRPQDDKGRYQVTRSANDEYVFRATPLRNVALTAPYFHSGEVWELSEAVKVMGTVQLGKQLSDADVQGIVRFLNTLTGKQPQITYPILPPSTETTPRPAE
jgi:cytochrome c peroxidase